jgi:predicted RNA-binding protein YlqC (UPF0109 family)
MIKELVTYIVKQLVDVPGDVDVIVHKNGNISTLEIKVNERDRGKLIGKQGQTIKAIRTLVNTLLPEDQKIIIEVSK